MWPDISIFRDGLINELEDGEQMEADNEYIGKAPERYAAMLEAFLDEVEQANTGN